MTEELKSNVKAIFTGKTVQADAANEHLVTLLEEILEMAKTGVLQSFVGTGFTSERTRLACWGDFHKDVYQMMGALNWLVHEYAYRQTTLEEMDTEYD